MRITSFTIWVILWVLFICQSSLAVQFENGKIEAFISTNKDLSEGRFVLEDEIVRFISEAQHTLDIAVQEIRSGKINIASNRCLNFRS